MDKSLYLSMSGTQNSMRQLEVLTNNLANINTTGFRADYTFAQQHHTSGGDNETRVYSKIDNMYTDFNKGSITNTGRDLDIAVKDEGFIAVQSKTGQEAYTRAGSLQLRDGMLTTLSGELVMGSAGVINLSGADRVAIEADGSISARYIDSADMVSVDRIKLANPDIAQLKKGRDGLFYLNENGSAQQDPNLKLITGALEGSNVNAIESMAKLIDLTRSYQIHTNYIKTISENTSKANQLLDVGR